jgi:hypothetical protein
MALIRILLPIEVDFPTGGAVGQPVLIYEYVLFNQFRPYTVPLADRHRIRKDKILIGATFAGQVLHAGWAPQLTNFRGRLS